MGEGTRALFLARPLLARLATCHNNEPRVVPMWFLWDGHHVLMETGASFPNARVLRGNPRAALVIDEAVGPLGFRAIVMRGTVEVVDDQGEVAATVRRIYEKYVGLDGLSGPTVQAMLAGSHVILRFSPTSEVSWDTVADAPIREHS